MGLLDGLIGGNNQQNNGYNQQQGGYPQQQGGYPEQGGYPQQQGGYPQGNQPAPVINYNVNPGNNVFSVVNELYCKAFVQSPNAEVFTKAGAMVAFKGNVKFDKVVLGPQGNPLAAIMGQVGRRLTGENMPLMKCKGSGQVILADEARHVTVIPLTEQLCVESEDLLAFTENCKYGFKFLAQGALSQKGLFTSTLNPNGSNAWVAILTSGNPLIIDTPCNVDPDALVAWTGPDPSLKLDIGWRNLIGQASGESYNFEFRQPGHKVIIQPDERKSGLDISVDSRNGNADRNQVRSGGPQFGNHGGTGSNQSFGGAASNAGGALGAIGNLFGGGGGNSGGGGMF
ncbi:MAG: AIM24 family protein [Oscillospiraceae bacterium]|jgi:uncharacterized protein (AIM24 family)|nr:AIM24 family protein [Oscillospiraceae bacterium]